MSNLIIEKLLAKTKRTDLPKFVPGDSVRVHVKIKEGDKERTQAFRRRCDLAFARSSGQFHRAQDQLWSRAWSAFSRELARDRQS
jgi:hypothetical protein